MKKTQLALYLVLICNLLQAQQIADATRDKNGYTKVYDVKNKLIASGYLGNSNDSFFFSNCILTIRDKNAYTRVYDEKLKLISSGYIGSSNDFVNISGCNIVCKDKNGYRRIYNQNLKLLSSGY
jgi:hypothetical protein